MDLFPALGHAKVSLLIPRDGDGWKRVPEVLRDWCVSKGFGGVGGDSATSALVGDRKKELEREQEEFEAFLESIPTRDSFFQGELLRFFLVIRPHASFLISGDTSKSHVEEEDEDFAYLRAHAAIEARELEAQNNLFEKLRLLVRFAKFRGSQTSLGQASSSSTIAAAILNAETPAKVREGIIEKHPTHIPTTTTTKSTSSSEPTTKTADEPASTTTEGEGTTTATEPSQPTSSSEQKASKSISSDVSTTGPPVRLPNGVLLYPLSIPVLLREKYLNTPVNLTVSASPALFQGAWEQHVSEYLSPFYVESRSTVRQAAQRCVVRLPISISIEKAFVNSRHYFNVLIENTLDDVEIELQDLKCYTKFADVLTSSDSFSPAGLFPMPTVPSDGGLPSPRLSSEAKGPSRTTSDPAPKGVSPPAARREPSTPSSPMQGKFASTISGVIQQALTSSSSAVEGPSATGLSSLLGGLPARSLSNTGMSGSASTGSLASMSPSNDSLPRAGDTLSPSNSFSTSITRHPSSSKLVHPPSTAPPFSVTPYVFSPPSQTTPLRPNPTNDFVVRLEKEGIPTTLLPGEAYSFVISVSLNENVKPDATLTNLAESLLWLTWSIPSFFAGSVMSQYRLVNPMIPYHEWHISFECDTPAPLHTPFNARLTLTNLDANARDQISVFIEPTEDDVEALKNEFFPPEPVVLGPSKRELIPLGANYDPDDDDDEPSKPPPKPLPKIETELIPLQKNFPLGKVEGLHSVCFEVPFVALKEGYHGIDQLLIIDRATKTVHRVSPVARFFVTNLSVWSHLHSTPTPISTSTST